MKNQIKKVYRKLRSFMQSTSKINKKSIKEITKFKSDFWQTEEGSQAFKNGSDAEKLGIAKLMDIVINDIFLEYSNGQNKILDIGSGHGIVSMFLAEKGFDVTACDISLSLLNILKENASKNNLNIDIRQGKVQDIPAKDGEFDIIVSRMFLPHFPEWQNLLTEIARCCKKGGKLLIHFTSKENVEIAQKVGNKPCYYGTTDDTNNGFSYYAEAYQKQIDAVCKKNNLTFINRIPVTTLYYNRIIGSVLGQEKYQQFHTDLEEQLKDEAKLEFMVWLEQNLLRHLPVASSFTNILVLQKK